MLRLYFLIRRHLARWITRGPLDMPGGNMLHITGGTTSNSVVTTTSVTGSWNGPICQTCAKPYLGTHRCAPKDLEARAGELIDLARRLQGDGD